MDTDFDTQRYQEGWSQANVWADNGGRLERDPPASDEAFENGFADRLNELRIAQRPTSSSFILSQSTRGNL